MTKVDLSDLPHINISLQQRRILKKLSSNRITPYSDLVRMCPTQTMSSLTMAIHYLRRKIAPAGYKIIAHAGLGYSLTKGN